MPTITHQDLPGPINEVTWSRESSAFLDADNRFAGAPEFFNFTAKRQVLNTDPSNPLPLMQFFTLSADFENGDSYSNEWPEIEVAIDNPDGEVVRTETYTRLLVDAYELDYNGTEVWELLHGRAYEYEVVPTDTDAETMSMALHPDNSEE
ncbi:hypothetical protein U5801_21580 [Lamprobacter modestohalophilus]|uniref:hypothetical protein n=1 Tax=Lamprobacter modestohalophilus TaxID=1064514 RepID=UPI002ADEC558|nr:hypothetical protein [Lamprobacter modestohalophilus]MEA1052376.1 hypothetical protein [Lamprobacter modestohalophilus]